MASKETKRRTAAPTSPARDGAEKTKQLKAAGHGGEKKAKRAAPAPATAGLPPVRAEITQAATDALTLAGGALGVEALAQACSITPEEMTRALPRMEAEGTLVRSRKGRYALPAQVNMAVGRIQMTRRGDAYLLCTGGQPDAFVPKHALAHAMHGDRVLAQFTPGEGRQAAVSRILTRANETMVGCMLKAGRIWLFQPDDMRLPSPIAVRVPRGETVYEREQVVVRTARWPDQGEMLVEIVEHLGDSEQAATGLRAITRQFGLRESFPAPVLTQAQAFGDAVRPDVAQGREDLRAEQLFTIDGEDAQDFDDAVSLTALPGGNMLLGVHIADVSAYVEENSALDSEAYTRGTSVYLPGLTLPMLPEALSNGLCSLMPGVDRLAFSLWMEMDAQGKVVSHRLCKSVIRSCARLTYAHVNACLRGEAEMDGALLDTLRAMAALSGLIRARRMARGSIDFDLEESHIVLDAQGEPISVSPRERGESERIIEDFMLTANETIARHARDAGLPFLYRVHEEPDGERLDEFLLFAGNMGLRVTGVREGMHAAALQKVLAAAQGLPEQPIIAKLMLRAMKKARYSVQPIGHFGLAARDYCHFTSPIRRYPDLFIHRVLSLHCAGTLDAKATERLSLVAGRAADMSSETERHAVEAERAADALMKAYFMRSALGETYEGVISGVNPWGFYVTLPSTVEGLVHVRDLPGYYTFIAERYCLAGERTGRIFRIGDRVRVTVSDVRLRERQVMFTWAQ